MSKKDCSDSVVGTSIVGAGIGGMIGGPIGAGVGAMVGAVVGAVTCDCEPKSETPPPQTAREREINDRRETIRQYGPC